MFVNILLLVGCESDPDVTGAQGAEGSSLISLVHDAIEARRCTLVWLSACLLRVSIQSKHTNS